MTVREDHRIGPPSLEQLAREGHGAIQVDLPEPGEEPIIVTIGGPIKYWWSLPNDEWGKGIHGEYLQWRDAVEAAFVKAGFLLYLPYKATRGRWTGRMQQVNDRGIEISDVFVYLTPPGIPDEGTQEEIAHARECAVTVLHLPPGSLDDIQYCVDAIEAHAIPGRNINA